VISLLLCSLLQVYRHCRIDKEGTWLALEVYEKLARKVGMEEEVGKMWPVSENPLDVVWHGAMSMRAV
jgi:hypothetical protein